MGASEATDFNISVLDDPQSIAALSRPIDPATLGFLINQEFNRDLLFFLAISRLDFIESSAEKNVSETVTTYINDPLAVNSTTLEFTFDSLNFKPFYDHLFDLIREGLTVVVDQRFAPQPSQAAKASFCFDSALPDPTNSTPQPVSIPHTTTCPSQADLAVRRATTRTTQQCFQAKRSSFRRTMI